MTEGKVAQVKTEGWIRPRNSGSPLFSKSLHVTPQAARWIMMELGLRRTTGRRGVGRGGLYDAQAVEFIFVVPFSTSVW